MYISLRTAFTRNTLVSISNGAITLIILLIAPMGLAGVIINTLLVTASTFAVSTVADRVLLWLDGGQNAEFLGNSRSGRIRRHRN
ncbi:MAG: CRISPR-associated protein Csx18 [Rivularia sp. (in: cyanobacteria)]